LVGEGGQELWLAPLCGGGGGGGHQVYAAWPPSHSGYDCLAHWQRMASFRILLALRSTVYLTLIGHGGRLLRFSLTLTTSKGHLLSLIKPSSSSVVD
ncbi:hypothetical protein TYRP_023462, partial [Tyrophagus putrescentiae]